MTTNLKKSEIIVRFNPVSKLNESLIPRSKDFAWKKGSGLLSYYDRDADNDYRFMNGDVLDGDKKCPSSHTGVKVRYIGFHDLWFIVESWT